VLSDLVRHYQETKQTGKGRLFRLYDDPLEYGTRLGLGYDEVLQAMSELHEHGIGYVIRPQANTYGKWKFGLYKDFVRKSVADQSVTTTTTITRVGSMKDTASTTQCITTPRTTTPLSTPPAHPIGTQLTAPVYLRDLQVHPPGRLHNVILYLLGTLDPQRTRVLRDAANKGKKGDGNNRYGTKLKHSTHQVSPGGRLRLWIKDPDQLVQALEEFARYCNEDLGLDLDATFLGTAKYETAIEVGYHVSGDVPKYASCKVRVEMKGFTATVSFDKSLGDYELEVHARGQGPPEVVQEFTTMIVADAGMAKTLQDLPSRIAQELKTLMEPH
jgi:hypothetical protein